MRTWDQEKNGSRGEGDRFYRPGYEMAVEKGPWGGGPDSIATGTWGRVKNGSRGEAGPILSPGLRKALGGNGLARLRGRVNPNANRPRVME